MKRRTAAIVLALMVTISVLTVGFVMGGTRYSFQEQVPRERSQAALIISQLTDCNLTITFVDKPNLLYKIDIEYYEPVPIWFSYPQHEINIGLSAASANFRFYERVRSLNVTVGPAVFSLDLFMCHNLNSTIVYDGTVELNQTLRYYASGSLDVIVTEDIRKRIGASITSDDVRLDITVPTGFSGGLFFRSGSATVERTGWEYSVDIYSDTHAYGTYDGFYDTFRDSADLVFLVECDELYLKLVS
ncbi:MAG: hypothetical protein ACXACG_12315 [Candidatus Thorarchaeota archaeon]|jgi:hypothetical protein